MRTPTTRPSGTRRRRRAHPGTTGCSARCCGRSPTAWPRTCSARRSPSRAAEAGGRRSPTCWPRAVATRSARCCCRARTSTGRTRRTAQPSSRCWAEERVTLVLTATAPIHRWCSGWQTLVKHGLAQYPADAARHVVEFAALRAGRLAELVELIPASRRVVRLVRNSPPEPDLAADLAAALGLPDARQRRGHARAQRVPRDRHRGRAAHQPRRPRAGDRPGGARPPGAAARRRLRLPGRTRARGAVRRPRRGPGGRGRRGRLAGATSTRLLDPHGLLATWTDPTLPEWYRTISRREAVVPELEGAEDRETQLWRARQERGAYRKGLLRLGR